MHSLNQIRKIFLDYFVKNGHHLAKSSPLVPQNDPTLMFTNSGMVQFKNVFTGIEKVDFTTATSSQKCVRAGGKHNDLDNVGYTARHHTFFEMLGNFSFGDYFKEQAIYHAWTLLTKDLGLDKSKLYVTVYHEDTEAREFWKKISGISDDRIISINTDDNFWSMGDLGPCGPCTEIFYDHGEHIFGGLPGTKDQDGDRYIEIWNLVFMQYEQLPDKRINLPKQSVDTGMGLERISAVLQNVHDNYDTDLFKNLINASAGISHTDPFGEHKVSHRVIADHLRSACFLVADGVMPSNEGRGYVLRRIMRRAMRHAYQLGMKEPLMHQLAPVLSAQMGDHYQELKRAESLIVDVLKLEEERFIETVARGMKLLNEESINLSAGQMLDGNVAFKLYDTYGFPLDLTTDILRERKIKVDDKAFEAAMQVQRETARKASTGSGDKKVNEVYFELHNKFGATEFLGYDKLNCAGKVLAIVKDGKEVKEASEGTEIEFVTNQTCFYGESGGQVGDNGFALANNIELLIHDTKKYFGGLIVHKATVKKGKIKIDDQLELLVNGEDRDRLKANHSATHLLHAVLRKFFGTHVVQKGSIVLPEKLRFDFSSPKALTKEELLKVENEVNRLIRKNSDTATRLMDIDTALDTGAVALFGEKYGDEVRVVTMGEVHEGNSYSVELCGGTHVHASGDIGYFKITSEGAIAAGVRRIEAITGQVAIDYMNKQEEYLTELASILKSQPTDLAEKIKKMMNDNKNLQKQIDNLKISNLKFDPKLIQEVGATKLYCLELDDIASKDLRPIALDIMANLNEGIVALITKVEGKAGAVVAVSDNLTKKYNAVDLVKILAKELGGEGGGGKENFAQAGGANPHNAKKAFEQLKIAL